MDDFVGKRKAPVDVMPQTKKNDIRMMMMIGFYCCLFVSIMIYILLCCMIVLYKLNKKTVENTWGKTIGLFQEEKQHGKDTVMQYDVSLALTLSSIPRFCNLWFVSKAVTTTDYCTVVTCVRRKKGNLGKIDCSYGARLYRTGTEKFEKT